MLPILLAALSAAMWGTSDFCGGKASRNAPALAVTVLSQAAGLPVLAACVALVHGTPSLRTLAYGMIGGLCGFVGILLLYRGLSLGVMSVFAPVSAVTAALVPLGVGLALDRVPHAQALVGVGCAVVAIALVSMSGRHGPVTVRIIGMALAAGAMFGLVFVLLARGGTGAGMWPLVGMRLASVAVGTGAMIASRTPIRLDRVARRWTLAAGPLDILANVLYVMAAAGGLLSVVAPISALYPVSTVVLALLVDRERVHAVQLAGLGLAATALVLVAT